MSNLHLAIVLVALYLIFMRKPAKKEGFVSMHDQSDYSPQNRDVY